MPKNTIVGIFFENICTVEEELGQIENPLLDIIDESFYNEENPKDEISDTSNNNGKMICQHFLGHIFTEQFI